MFGDIGHGLILFIFGLLMIFRKKQLRREVPILALILPHRYLFALMGFFATYCGFIYNEFLSINLNLFGSCYDVLSAQENQAIMRQ
jgi:V-type H+-transporting ATPase subunit a